jgi:hypothetical protein
MESIEINGRRYIPEDSAPKTPIDPQIEDRILQLSEVVDAVKRQFDELLSLFPGKALEVGKEPLPPRPKLSPHQRVSSDTLNLILGPDDEASNPPTTVQPVPVAIPAQTPPPTPAPTQYPAVLPNVQVEFKRTPFDEITHTEEIYHALVARKGPMSVGDVRNALPNVNKTSITTLLNALIDKRLVKKTFGVNGFYQYAVCGTAVNEYGAVYLPPPKPEPIPEPRREERPKPTPKLKEDIVIIGLSTTFRHNVCQEVDRRKLDFKPRFVDVIKDDHKPLPRSRAYIITNVARDSWRKAAKDAGGILVFCSNSTASVVAKLVELRSNPKLSLEGEQSEI